jgi:hypothetical protein
MERARPFHCLLTWFKIEGDMRKIVLILFSALLLTACGGGGTANIGGDGLARPQIPHKRPVLPDPKKEQAIWVNPDPFSGSTMDRLIDRINENVSPQNIMVQDIDRGWYLGGKNDKKDGTPSTWIWVDKGKDSAWTSPSSLNETDDINLEKLCSSTAGAYAFSCIEREFSGCEHIANSLCRCPDQTQWNEKQGCILLGRDLKPIAISSSDLKRGWYYGLPNEKKLDTPANWVWIEGGQKSRWQTQSPLGNN